MFPIPFDMQTAEGLLLCCCRLLLCCASQQRVIEKLSLMLWLGKPASLKLGLSSAEAKAVALQFAASPQQCH